MEEKLMYPPTPEEMHAILDMMVARFISETTNLPSKTTLLEFMQWSFEQAKKEK